MNLDGLMPSRKVHKGDAIAAFAMSALAVGLLVFAVPNLGPLPEAPTSWNGLIGFLKGASPWLIVLWSAASLPLAYGWGRGSRRAFALGLALNLLYLAISLAGLAYFGMTMHGLFAGYAVARLLWLR
jgi:hypothetical protein